MAQTTVNIRMDQELKDEVERVCDEMGMSMSTAFKIFAKRLAHDREIPFTVGSPYPAGFPIVNTWEELSDRIEYGLREVALGQVVDFDEAMKQLRNRHGV